MANCGEFAVIGLHTSSLYDARNGFKVAPNRLRACKPFALGRSVAGVVIVVIIRIFPPKTRVSELIIKT
jgi:hypothetical protein